jgi:AcrR family transcriptional regulator
MADGRVLRAERVRERRRKDILATSLRVFSEQGYWNTSITDLVRAAGVARGTFYLYFESKSSIFLELLTNLLSTLRGAVSGVDPSRDDSLEEQVVAVVTRVFETLQQNRPLTRIVFREAVGLDAEVDAQLDAFNRELRGYLENTIAIGQAMGWLREEMDRSIMATSVLGAVREAVLVYVVRGKEEVEARKVAEQIVAFSLRGMTA